MLQDPEQFAVGPYPLPHLVRRIQWQLPDKTRNVPQALAISSVISETEGLPMRNSAFPCSRCSGVAGNGIVQFLASAI
jgi:hypothetical protein